MSVSALSKRWNSVIRTYQKRRKAGPSKTKTVSTRIMPMRIAAMWDTSSVAYWEQMLHNTIIFGCYAYASELSEPNTGRCCSISTRLNTVIYTLQGEVTAVCAFVATYNLEWYRHKYITIFRLDASCSFFRYWTTRWLVNSRTGHLVDWTRDNSRKCKWEVVERERSGDRGQQKEVSCVDGDLICVHSFRVFTINWRFIHVYLNIYVRFVTLFCVRIVT